MIRLTKNNSNTISKIIPRLEKSTLDVMILDVIFLRKTYLHRCSLWLYVIICIQVLSRDRLLDYLVFSPTMMIVIHEFTAFCQNRMKTIRSGTNSSQFERDHVYHIGSIVVIRESTNLECPRFTVFNAILKYTTKIRCPNSFIFHCLLFVCF